MTVQLSLFTKLTTKEDFLLHKSRCSFCFDKPNFCFDANCELGRDLYYLWFPFEKVSWK